MRLQALIWVWVLVWAAAAADLRYELRIQIGADGQLQGEATIRGTAAANWTEIPFRLYPAVDGRDRLSVHAVFVEDQQGEWWSPEPTVVWVSVRLEPGQTFSVSLHYSGQVPRFSSTTGYGIFARTESTITLAQAYPILAPWRGAWIMPASFPWGDAIVAEVADYTAEVQAPVGWRVVASGREEEVAPGVWRVSGEDLRELGLVLVRGYEVQTALWEGVTVRSFYPPRVGSRAQTALQVTIDTLEVYKVLGEFPFDELDLVPVPLAGAGGVEYPGLILAGLTHYEPYAHDPFFFAMIFAHEVAHQFWYAEVGNDPVTEPWLDEALTTYTSGLYFAAQGQLPAILAYWERSYAAGRSANPQARITSPLWEFPQGRGYGGIVYSGGALWFHRVRERMGDEAFFEALRRFRQEFQGQIARGEDLLRILAEESPVPLDDLFSELGG